MSALRLLLPVTDPVTVTPKDKKNLALGDKIKRPWETKQCFNTTSQK